MFRRYAKNDAKNPHLWGTNHVPYDHVIIPYDDLDGALRDDVDYVIWARGVAAKRAGIASIAYGALVFYIVQGYVLPTISLSVIIGLTNAMALNNIMEDHKDASLAEKNKRLDAAMQTLVKVNVPGLMYVESRDQTEFLSRHFKKLGKLDLLPGAKNIHDYNYGIVNNRGDIILIKHPESKLTPDGPAWKTWLKIKAFKQPFQRTRFDISPVIKKEKERGKNTVKGAAPKPV